MGKQTPRRTCTDCMGAGTVPSGFLGRGRKACRSCDGTGQVR